jgi:hypothetical protein
MVPPIEIPSGGTSRLSAQDWLRAFRDRYDRAAESTLTDLGLFYDRHRRFVEFEKLSDPHHPEYTDEEWDRVMALFLSELSSEFGLVQARDWETGENLDWFRPTEPQQPAVAIRPANHAGAGVVDRDLPQVVSSGAELAVLLLYPDYPSPPGARSIDEATREWKARLERALQRLRPSREFLLLTISAFSWDLPAPWKGFLWNPGRATLEEVR